MLPVPTCNTVSQLCHLHEEGGTGLIRTLACRKIPPFLSEIQTQNVRAKSLPYPGGGVDEACS